MARAPAPGASAAATLPSPRRLLAVHRNHAAEVAAVRRNMAEAERRLAWGMDAVRRHAGGGTETR